MHSAQTHLFIIKYFVNDLHEKIPETAVVLQTRDIGALWRPSAQDFRGVGVVFLLRPRILLEQP